MRVLLKSVIQKVTVLLDKITSKIIILLESFLHVFEFSCLGRAAMNVCRRSNTDIYIGNQAVIFYLCYNFIYIMHSTYFYQWLCRYGTY